MPAASPLNLPLQPTRLPFSARRLAWAVLALVLAPLLPLVARAQASPATLMMSKGGEHRVALVVGNAAYRESPLKNPVNDARAMRKKLGELGFEIVYFENLQTRQVGAAMREFRNKIRPGSVALFFYAGHGLQVRGENYLPTVDAVLASEEDVPHQSLNLAAVLNTMEDSKAGVNLVLLDACRNNPYARSFRSSPRGLARVQAPSGTLIHYATRPGSVAEDGGGRHGTYTEALLAQIDEKGVPIETALKRVTIKVRDATKGKQEPWMEGSLTGDFFFTVNGNPQITVQQAPAAPATPDAAAWQAASSVNSVEAYQAYLNEFPTGLYAAAARIKLAAMRPAPTTVAAAPAPRVAPQQTEEQRRAAQERQQAAEREALRTAALREMSLARLAAGSFTMGADVEGGVEDDKPDESALPQRSVAVSNFELAYYEVTVGQFKKFVQATGYVTEAEKPSQPGCQVPAKGGQWVLQANAHWRAPGHAQTDSHPVVCVSWNDVQAYLAWINGSSNERFRLPSEAEWEYAARGGTTTPRPWSEVAGFWTRTWQSIRSGGGDQPASRTCRYANVADETLRSQMEWPGAFNCKDGYAQATPGGYFSRNNFSLYDMLGNAAEWTQDCWNPSHAGAPLDATARQSGDCERRVLRGGSWASTQVSIRSAARSSQAQNYRASDVGFRLARSPKP